MSLSLLHKKIWVYTVHTFQYNRESQDNTVSISTVPCLTRFFLKEIARFLNLTKIHISCHMKPRSSNQFLPLMTLNENNWVAKYSFKDFAINAGKKQTLQILIPQYLILVLKLYPIYMVSLKTVFLIFQNQCYPRNSCIVYKGTLCLMYIYLICITYHHVSKTHVTLMLTSKFSEKVSVFLTTNGKIRTKCEFNVSSNLKLLAWPLHMYTVETGRPIKKCKSYKIKPTYD